MGRKMHRDITKWVKDIPSNAMCRMSEAFEKPQASAFSDFCANVRSFHSQISHSCAGSDCGNKVVQSIVHN